MSDERNSVSPFDEVSAKLEKLKSDLIHLKDVIQKCRAGKVFAADDELRKYPGLVNQVTTTVKELADDSYFERVAGLIRDAIDEGKATYRDTIEMALRDATIPLAGAWPTYWLADVLRLQVEFGDGRVRVGQRWLKTLDPERITATARTEINKLVGRPFDPATFVRLVAEAHGGVVSASGTTAHDYADIRDVFKAVQSRQGHTYSPDLFAADLHRLRRTGVVQEGLRVELSPARNPKTGLLIPGPDGGFVSGLRVRKEDTASND